MVFLNQRADLSDFDCQSSRIYVTSLPRRLGTNLWRNCCAFETHHEQLPQQPIRVVPYCIELGVVTAHPGKATSPKWGEY